MPLMHTECNGTFDGCKCTREYLRTAEVRVHGALVAPDCVSKLALPVLVLVKLARCFAEQLAAIDSMPGVLELYCP